MTKAQIISFVSNNLLKIDKTNKYHYNVIEKAITLAFNQGYTDVFEQDPRSLDAFTVTYGTTGSPLMTALNANGSTIYEATIPVTYATFNDKSSGVRHVFSLAKSSVKFYPMTKYELDIADNTLAGEIDDRIGYVVRPTVIEFFGMTGATSIRIDVVQTFSDYNDTDDVNIPFGNDQKLIDLVVERLRGIPPVDLKDDNSDKSWQTQRR